MTSDSVFPDRKLFRTKQAAAYLSVSSWKLRQLARLGKIAYVQLEEDGPFTFDRLDLDNYAQEHRIQKIEGWNYHTER